MCKLFFAVTFSDFLVFVCLFFGYWSFSCALFCLFVCCCCCCCCCFQEIEGSSEDEDLFGEEKEEADSDEGSDEDKPVKKVKNMELT